MIVSKERKITALKRVLLCTVVLSLSLGTMVSSVSADTSGRGIIQSRSKKGAKEQKGKSEGKNSEEGEVNTNSKGSKKPKKGTTTRKEPKEGKEKNGEGKDTKGTPQNVDKSDVDRDYIKDSRRGDSDSIRFISDDKATKSLMGSVTSKANSSVDKGYILVYTSDGMLSFSNRIYRKLTDEEKKTFMKSALGNIKESDLPSKVKVKASKFISEQDLAISKPIQAFLSDSSSELSAAYNWFVPFTGPLSTILGFLAIVIFAFLGLSIVIDTSYLSIGAFRSILEGFNDDGKPKFVSVEAYEIAIEGDNTGYGGNYRNPLIVYIKRRSGIFIVAGILFSYLITGQIYSFLVWFFNLFEVIWDVLKG